MFFLKKEVKCIETRCFVCAAGSTRGWADADQALIKSRPRVPSREVKGGTRSHLGACSGDTVWLLELRGAWAQGQPVQRQEGCRRWVWVGTSLPRLLCPVASLPVGGAGSSPGGYARSLALTWGLRETSGFSGHLSPAGNGNKEN